MEIQEIPTNQKLLDEINELCEKYGYEMINVVLSNPKKMEGDPEKFIIINRLTMEELLNLSKKEVKH